MCAPSSAIMPISDIRPQEVVGRQEAAARVAPARQRLEAGELAGGEPHDRLEEGHDLAALDGAAQVGLQRQAREPVALQRAAVGGGRRAAAGGLGRPRWPARRGAAARRPPARRRRPRPSPRRSRGSGGCRSRRPAAAAPAPRAASRRAGVSPSRRQHGELVLADPGHQRRFREGGGQARAQRRQHQVGALVAQRLVQAAQAVEVGDHQLVAARLGQLLAGAGDEAAAVQQAGQARRARRR